ncbi:MAG: M48 family metalloprotease [Gemmatimonadaceae bacterium]|nr:M48 family metalloprotease [Gemmatimonadaceae bacterium]
MALVSACAISTQQEVEMGASYAAEINRQLPLVQDAELNRYMNVLGDSLARIADTRNLDWHFYIVDSPDVNAFAVPGGFIYMNRGLMERATNLAQVAGVLGHEIGHVTQRHSVEQMQKAQRTNVGVVGVCIFLPSVCGSQTGQAAISLGANAAMASFSRADEDEADKVAIDYLVRAGIDPQGVPEMFEILLAERKSKPDGLDTWFRSHPLEESRIANGRARIAKYPPESLVGLTRDTPGFQAFQRRLKALPPSPRQ